MRNLFFLAILPFFVLSCEKEIPLEADEIQPRIVINGIFEAGDTMEIHVSESRNVLYDGILPNLENASAKLYDANDNFLGDFTGYPGGIYRLENYLPVVGMSYKIKVTHSGFDDVSSQTNAPSLISITSIDTLRKGEYLNYEIKFNDDPAAVNYYAVTIDKITFYEDEFTGELHSFNDPGSYTNEIYVQSGYEDNSDGTKWGDIFLFSDATFNGGICSFSAEKYDYQSIDSSFVVISVRSLSEDYFKYSISLDKYNQTDGDPFAQPVQVYSNVENGFGIFSGYSVARDTIWFE